MLVQCKHEGEGSNASSDYAVFNCFHEFQRNKFTVQDDPHSICQQIEAILGISSTAINSIIHDYLNLRKVCARWMPLTLIDDQKQVRAQFCSHSLRRFEEGRSRRVFDIITGDESCFYHYDPQLKEQ